MSPYVPKISQEKQVQPLAEKMPLTKILEM
jgi:hypothetical protein